MNIFASDSGWTVFGAFQIYWGIQEMQKFWRYKNLEEKGDEDKDILLSIEQEEIEDSIHTEIVEAEGSNYKEKSLIEESDLEMNNN